MSAAEIFYMRRAGAYGAENYALMEKFKQWIQMHNLFCEGTVILAVALDDPVRTKSELRVPVLPE